MTKTNVRVEFAIIGDKLKPDIISKRLAIIPNEYWLKGEIIEGKNIKRKENCWIVYTEFEESFDINDQITKIINLFENKEDILKELKQIYDVEYIISIVVNIENNQKPAMYFDNNFIEFVYKIKAEFYIDLFIYS